MTRSGNNFTAKNAAGTTLYTFSQKDDNTTYGNATQSADGLMSAADKTKIDKAGFGPEIQMVSWWGSRNSIGLTIAFTDGTNNVVSFKPGNIHVIES